MHLFFNLGIEEFGARSDEKADTRQAVAAAEELCPTVSKYADPAYIVLPPSTFLLLLLIHLAGVVKACIFMCTHMLFMHRDYPHMARFLTIQQRKMSRAS